MFCSCFQLFILVGLQQTMGLCGGLEMAPHENKWSPLDGAHE